MNSDRLRLLEFILIAPLAWWGGRDFSLAQQGTRIAGLAELELALAATLLVFSIKAGRDA